MLPRHCKEFERFDEFTEASRPVLTQSTRKAINCTFACKGAFVSWLQTPALVYDPGVLRIVELLQESKLRHVPIFLLLGSAGVLTNFAILPLLFEMVEELWSLKG